MRNWDSKLFDQLNSLQDLDLETRSLQTQIEDFTRKSKEEDPQIVQLKRELDEIEQRMAASSAQYQMYVDTLEDIRTAIAGMTSGKPSTIKARTRSSTEALKVEEEKLASLVQDTVAQLRLQEETRTEISGKIAARSNAVEAQQRGPEAEIRLLLARIDELAQQRDTAAAGIPIELLRTYERLSRSRSGVALTRLLNGVCLICRMEMPTAIVSRLKLGDTIAHCPACGRLVSSVEFDETYDNTQSKRATRLVDTEEDEEEEEELPRRPIPMDDDTDDETELVATEEEDGEPADDTDEPGETKHTGDRIEGHTKSSPKIALSKTMNKPGRLKISEMKSTETDSPSTKPGKKKDSSRTKSAEISQKSPPTSKKSSQRASIPPAKPVKVPSKAAKAPAKPAKAPAKPPKAPAKPAKAPAKPAKTPAKPAKAPAKPAKAPAKPAKAPAKPAKTPSKPPKAPAKPAKTPSKPPKAPAKPAKPAKTIVKPTKSSARPSRGKSR
jgi:predicted  nucleic acid-binding Zn-ribbon protein